MASSDDLVCDVAIVGSGVAGALAAYRLVTTTSKRVVIVEAGDELSEDDRMTLVRNFFVSATKSQSSPYAGATAPQPSAEKQGRDYYEEDPNAPFGSLLTSYYERLVGGSTWHWQGINIRMIPSDFRLRSDFGVGMDWPIGYDDLEEWYCDAESEMGVAGDDEEAKAIFADRLGAHRSRGFPMPALAPSYLDHQFRQALAGVTFEGVPLTVTSIAQAKNSVASPDGRPACDGRSSCIPLCPTRAKYEATFHVAKAVAAGATLVPRAIVTGLELDDHGLVSRAVYRRWDGGSGGVRAKVFVLAANGVETPKILLLSTTRASSGLANSSGRVGQYLMDHPIKMSYALSRERVYPFRGPPSTSSIETLRDGPFRQHRAAFRTTIRNDGWTWPTGAPRGSDLGKKGTVLDFVGNQHKFGEALKQALVDHTTRQIMVNSALEMLPDAANAVTIGTTRDMYGVPRPAIRFAVDDYVRAGFLAAIRVHARIFQAMNATEFHLQADSESDAGSGHIMGTTIMGNDPRTSVVDPDGRAHDHRNLFILGSSVFPTGATANPTLTIAALALRAVPSIVAELGS